MLIRSRRWSWPRSSSVRRWRGSTTSDARIAELTAIVKTFERMLYGRRSERLRGDRLDDEQIDFVFDEIATGVAAIDAELETAAKDKPKRAPRPRKDRAGY